MNIHLFAVIKGFDVKSLFMKEIVYERNSADSKFIDA